MAALALKDRLASADRNKRDPEQVKEGPRPSWLEHRILATMRAVAHAAAGALIITYHPPCSEEDYHQGHHFPGLPAGIREVGATR